jgi:hypothetical protein
LPHCSSMVSRAVVNASGGIDGTTYFYKQI